MRLYINADSKDRARPEHVHIHRDTLKRATGKGKRERELSVVEKRCYAGQRMEKDKLTWYQASLREL